MKNPKSRFYSRLVLAVIGICSLLGAQPQIPALKNVVGAYYYPWYNTSKWSSHEPQLTPSLGQYTTDDISIADQHIDWAFYYGVDVMFMSWWKPDELTDVHLKEGYLRSANVNKMKFAMLLEPVVMLDHLDGESDVSMDFNVQAVLDGWISMFQYFKDNFWDHPSYYRVGGKPVVMMYITRQYKNFGPEDIAAMKAAVGDVYLMADEAFLFGQADPLAARNGVRNNESVFESYVSYNAYEAQFINTGETALSYQTRIAMPYYEDWAEHTIFHPPIMPYYQDFREGHPPLPGTVSEFYDVIDQIMALPMETPAAPDLNRIFMVTSWNEWFEGTSIEPSVEHGHTFAEVIRDVFVKQGLHSRPEVTTIQTEVEARFRSHTTDDWLCIDKQQGHFLKAHALCHGVADLFTLVALGSNEFAIRHNETGKYLSVYSDSLVYPLQDYIGTWEIFTRTLSADRMTFQSKKLDTWLTVSPGGGKIMASSATGGETEKFYIGTGFVGTGDGKMNYSVNPPELTEFHVTGDAIQLTFKQGGKSLVKISDVNGKVVWAQQSHGQITVHTSSLPSKGVYLLQVEGLPNFVYRFINL